jgi:uncharacterized protein with HEPN domain
VSPRDWRFRLDDMLEALERVRTPHTVHKMQFADILNINHPEHLNRPFA